ncbi:MAG: hypothetical protein RLZZ214_3115 [Verrucomicrobiota bacterium]|jgi:hypothetical protein
MMMLNWIFIMFCLMGVATSEEDWRAEERRDEAKQIELWEGNLKKSSGMSGFEKIDFLALGLKNMAYRKSRFNHGKEVDKMFEEIQTTILAIPGHAEFYRDRINEARANLDGATLNGNVTKIAERRSDWSSAKFGFGVMSYLPSPETVRVLGEFLGDDRGKIVVPKDAGDDEKQGPRANVPNSYQAVMALHSLPIVSKPYRPLGGQFVDDDFEPSIASWQIWYEQIKSGNRTFRFEGDPTEYDLNGPASKELIQRVERDRKRDDERAVGHKKSSTTPAPEPTLTQTNKPYSIAWLVAASGLIGAAVWYLLRGRKTA